jgi:replicative DNA helicase
MAVSTLDYVTFYAERSWRLFPIKPHDKFPLFPAAHEKGNPCKGECGQLGHGFHDATAKLPVLTEWWNKYPDANIGIATGINSGFMVLDVDPKHGGDKSLAELISKHGELPKTPMSKTGGGGQHYLFAYPHGFDIRNSSGKVGPGLDIRAEGGYIVAPPSLHESGNHYEWDKSTPPSQTQLANCPKWLFDLIVAKPEVQPVMPTRTEGAYISGQRNSALASLAGSMRRRGMSDDSIFVALNAENLNKCVPPLTEGEVRTIAMSIGRYGPSAAPAMQNKDRATAEWAFCKSIYESPEDYVDHQNVKPEMFGDKQLAEYWTDVLMGVSVAQAATNAGVLTELEKYNDWLLPRIDDYASAIKQFAYSAKVEKFGWMLQEAAKEGDTAKIDRVILDINKGVELSSGRITSINDAADEVEREVIERSKNPVDVWGIPYAFPYLSSLTGGKQTGELTIIAGEPKVGKSWWVYQDALETAIKDTPVYVWSGEMRRKQVMRRMYQLLGVNGRNMRTGKMTEEDWDKMNDARAVVLNSPLYIDDTPMRLVDLRSILMHEKIEHGIKQFVIDYAYLVNAPGKDEIERTGNVSQALKIICGELDLCGHLITSVSKAGMDSTSEQAVKSNIRGSGQQIHDADIVYMLTKFSPASDDGVALMVKPTEYDKMVTLHIQAGRELDHSLPKGVLHYKRMDNSPKFEEMSKPKVKR